MLSIRQLGARLAQSFFARQRNVDRSQRRRPLMLEALEPRLLLSVSLDGGTGLLSGSFTDSDDTVVIAQTAVAADLKPIITLTVGGMPTTYGTASAGVSAIELDGLKGADQFTLVSILGIDVTLEGGDGADTLTGPNGATSWLIDAVDGGSIPGAGAADTTSRSIN